MQGLPKIGDVLDDTYRIEELIGKGGFGAVYRALQLSMQREVALKILVAHALNVDEMIERFRREVMAVRNLGHPNTIRIYDFRDRADGLLYYAMEYVNGPTLEDLISETGPMVPNRVAHILKQTLKSLSEAHSYGIVHRDLKPANIMLADVAGETDFVKVLDFGIAKIIDGDDAEERKQITNAGVLVGTLNYMSPEQIAGGKINPSSDLYALALMGVEMLTGKSVFAGTGQWEVLHKQISDEPVEIPDVVSQSVLGPVLMRALHKRQDQRYARAEDMLEALAGLGDVGNAPLLSADEIPDKPTREVKVESKPQPRPTAPAPTPQPTPAPTPNPAAAPAAADGSFESAATQMVDKSAPDIQKTQPAEAITGPREPQPTPAPQRTKSNIRETNPAISGPNPAVQQANRQPLVSPTGQQQTRQNLGATVFTPGENTDPGPGESSSSNTGLIVVAVTSVLLVIALTVALIVIAGGGDDDVTPAETTPPVVEPPTSPVAAETPPVIDEPEEPAVEQPPEDEPVEVATKQVRLLTPGVNAEVYVGGKLIGETPMSMGVSKAETYRIAADGYEPQEVDLSPESDDVVDVKLARIVAENDSPRANKKPASSDDGWVDVPVKKNEKKPKEKKPKEKKPKEKKTEVPVF